MRTIPFETYKRTLADNILQSATYDVLEDRFMEALISFLYDSNIPVETKQSICNKLKSEIAEENLRYSFEIIRERGDDPNGNVAIVSSAYHLYRAKRMAAALGMNADGLPSSDGYAVYMAGMYVREGLAVWKLWLLGR